MKQPAISKRRRGSRLATAVRPGGISPLTPRIDPSHLRCNSSVRAYSAGAILCSTARGSIALAGGRRWSRLPNFNSLYDRQDSPELQQVQVFFPVRQHSLEQTLEAGPLACQNRPAIVGRYGAGSAHLRQL